MAAYSPKSDSCIIYFHDRNEYKNVILKYRINPSETAKKRKYTLNTKLFCSNDFIILRQSYRILVFDTNGDLKLHSTLGYMKDSKHDYLIDSGTKSMTGIRDSFLFVPVSVASKTASIVNIRYLKGAYERLFGLSKFNSTFARYVTIDLRHLLDSMACSPVDSYPYFPNLNSVNNKCFYYAVDRTQDSIFKTGAGTINNNNYFPAFHKKGLTLISELGTVTETWHDSTYTIPELGFNPEVFSQEQLFAAWDTIAYPVDILDWLAAAYKNKQSVLYATYQGDELIIIYCKGSDVYLYSTERFRTPRKLGEFENPPKILHIGKAIYYSIKDSSSSYLIRIDLPA